MKANRLEQIKFLLGIESECDVMTLQDKHDLIYYIENYDNEESYKYALVSDGNIKEDLYRYSCSLFDLKRAFQKTRQTSCFLHKQVSSIEYQLIKNDYEVITLKTI